MKLKEEHKRKVAEQLEQEQLVLKRLYEAQAAKQIQVEVEEKRLARQCEIYRNQQLAAKKMEEKRVEDAKQAVALKEAKLAGERQLEEARQAHEALRAERLRGLESLRLEKEAKEKAECERVQKLWADVYATRAFKNASPNCKLLISKECPEGLCERLKDVRFLNSLELASRKL